MEKEPITANGKALLASEEVNRIVDEMILNGQAETGSEAEEKFLDEHLDDLLSLVACLPDNELAAHEAIKLLMSHGSRRWEDAIS